MRSLKVLIGSLIVVSMGLSQGNPITLVEGARLIMGDGSVPIESSAFIVQNNRFTTVGKKGEVQAPPGAARIDLNGKTVIPALIDVHSHFGFLNQRDGSMSKANFNRENLLDHLKRYAYHGFAAAISMGTDFGDLPYQLREEVHPGAALFRTVGRGLAWPGSGPRQPTPDRPKQRGSRMDFFTQLIRQIAEIGSHADGGGESVIRVALQVIEEILAIEIRFRHASVSLVEKSE